MKRTRSSSRLRPVLVTGFEPFGGETTNPSQDVARALDGRVIAGRVVVAAVLPCVFGESRRQLRCLLRRHRPAVTICLGLAAGRAAITPERVAINVDDARIRDNAGQLPVDRPVVRGAPAAYWSTLPVKAIVRALRARGWPAEVSQTAGTFVCNHVFFSLMHALRQAGGRGGFVHMPHARETAPGGEGDARALPRAELVAAVETAVAVAVRRRRDAGSSGGAEY
jgi:pyroglutamyl-peptidase